MPRQANVPALVVLLVACSGLDPGAFQSNGSKSSDPETAGWSFDAGTEAGAKGGSEAGAAGRAGAGARPSGGRAGEGGEGGEADEGRSGSGANGGGSSGSGSAGASGRDGVGGSGGGSGSYGGRGGAGGGGVSGRGGSGSGGQGGNGGKAGAGGGGGAPVHAVFFSEYVEGSSSYKALEITAREASTLVGCRLVTYFNGSSSGTAIALDGALSKASAYVLCSSALATLLGSACQRATNLTFNGDDAVALECAGVTLDVIGQIGVDPGDAWGGADASTLNQTLRRNCASSAGDPDGADAFDPANEWSALPSDTFDGLGQVECPGE